MNLLIYLIILFQIFSFSFSYSRTQIPIGVIFHENNTEAEIAFHNVILRENDDNKIVEFKPFVYTVDRGDSWRAEEIACELASKGVYAIFGPSSIETSKIVGSICNELGIPHIITHWIPVDEKNTTEQHQHTRNFFPENNLYAQALAKIIDDYQWKGFTLIYDNNECLERLQDVLQQNGPQDQPITIRQLPEDDDYKPLLKLIESSKENRIIIDCSPDKVVRLFNQAVDVKMMTPYQSYIVTSLDAHILDFAELKYGGANITTIRLMNPSSPEVTKAYKGIGTDRIKTEIALVYDALGMFLTSFMGFNAVENISPPTRLLCSSTTHSNKWNQGMDIIKYLNQKTNVGMTGRIIFDDVGRRTDFYMEILELNQVGVFNKIAILDPQTMKINYTRTEEEVQSRVMKSLQNETVIVASRIGMPWLKERERREGENFEGNEKYEGYAIDLIAGIAKNLGFQYRFDIVPDNAYGAYDKKKKSWNGLVKHLLDRKAHLAICDLTITYERRTAVDFTMPFMTLGISILYAKPHKETPGLFSFMAPLSLQVWFFMATAYLCISVLLFFLAKTAVDDWGNPHPCIPDPEELETIWNMHNCIWLTAGSIMQQGCDILPKAISTRLTAGLWWFFALIVISSYTANLAAFLTMERMDASIENVEDLAKQTNIKYGVVDSGSTLSFFKESNFSTYQRMWTAMDGDKSVFAKNNDEGVDRVKKGKHMYAFLMESTFIEYTVERNCDLTQIGGLLDSKGYGIAMPVNSPYRSYISQTVLKMQEEGKLHRLKNKWWKEINNPNKETGCSDGKGGDGDTQELGMDKVVGVFLVLAGGLGISIIIGILEFLWNVSKVSVAEKITPWEAFKSELRFALDIRTKTKMVHKISSESESESLSSRSSKSLDHSVVPGWRFNMEEKQKSQV